MKNQRDLKRIVIEARQLHDALTKAIQKYNEEFDSVAKDPYYSKLAIAEAREKRQMQIQAFVRKQSRILDDLRTEAHDLVKNDDASLDYSMIDQNLVSLLQLRQGALSENQYRLLAVRNARSEANLALIKTCAETNGYVLDIGKSAAEQLEFVDASFDRLEKVFGNALTKESLDDDFVELSFKNTLSALEPIQPEQYRCYERSIEAAIANEMQTGKVISEQTDKDFFEGFGVPIDDNYAEALSDVSKVLFDFSPQKKARILSAIVRTNDPEHLTAKEALSADHIKLTADAIRRSGDSASADELADIASLMRSDGLVYAPDFGTRTQPDSSGLHRKHAQMIQQAKQRSEERAERAERVKKIEQQVENEAEYE